MALCRECDALLWRTHETCPCCAARRPALALGTLPSQRSRPAVVRTTVAVLLGLPALLAVDRLLLQALTA